MNSPPYEQQPLDLKLTDDEIHVWICILDQSLLDYFRFIEILSKDERLKAKRFHFLKDRKRFIARHGMLRILLGNYLGLKASEIMFCLGINGKPAIKETYGNGPIKFNISHSNGVALFGFARNYEIGVDIEHIREINYIDQVIERYFSLKENIMLRSLPESQKKEAFYKIWTSKEAYIKALGDGLSLPLDQFDVSYYQSGASELFKIGNETRKTSRWSIQNIQPAPNYAGALAVNNQRFEIKHFQWNSMITNGNYSQIRGTVTHKSYTTI